MSSTTVVSLPIAADSPPSPQPESTTQKALRFINIPVKARRQESGAQRQESGALFAVPPSARLPRSCIETCLAHRVDCFSE
jgi:hypothetical protein